MLQIQMVSGLVEKENLRLLRECRSKKDALPLTAAKVAEITGEKVLDACHFDCASHSCFVLDGFIESA